MSLPPDKRSMAQSSLEDYGPWLAMLLGGRGGSSSGLLRNMPVRGLEPLPAARGPSLVAPKLPPGAPGPVPPPIQSSLIQNRPVAGMSSQSGMTRAGQPPSFLDTPPPAVPPARPIRGTQPDRPASMFMRPPSRSAPPELSPVVPRPMDMAQPPQGAAFVPPRHLEALRSLNAQPVARPLTPPAIGPQPQALGQFAKGAALGAGAMGAGALAGSLMAEPKMPPPPPAPPPIRAELAPRAVPGESPDPLDGIETPEQLIQMLWQRPAQSAGPSSWAPQPGP